jgi:hypothetical protein
LLFYGVFWGVSSESKKESTLDGIAHQSIKDTSELEATTNILNPQVSVIDIGC